MKRCEQKSENTWDLSSLCKDIEDFKARYDLLINKVSHLSSYNTRLGESSDVLYCALEEIKDVLKETECISSYAFLLFESDASNSTYSECAGKASYLSAKVSEELSFFEPEILAIDEKKLKEMLSEDRFEEYRIFIEKVIRFKPHTLTKNEERILSLNAQAAEAPSRAFHDLVDVDLDFGLVNNEKLTQSSYMSFIRSEDENIRKDAYFKLHQTFEKNQHVIARLYEGSINQDIFQSQARGYKSSLEASLFADNVSEEVYRNLINAVHDGFPALHRYYSLMAKVQNKEKLKHYDVYLPLVKDIKCNYTYDEAVNIIKEAVAPLGKEYQELLVKGLTTERWVDRYENEGKRSGAFSAGCYTGKPYILTNYKDDVLDSVFTLIHEGGHSMHSYYSATSNPYMHYNYTIFEAEVASTFNEQLLSRYLISNTSDEKMKAYLISHELSSIVATLFRQTMFAEYELLIHEAVERGEVATVEVMRKTYRTLLESYFGPIMEFESFSDVECLRIPHFYTAFYVYKYSTGISAAIALCNRVLNGAEKERTDYLSFLKSGGSKYPIESLKLGGVDMAKKESVQKAIKHFETLLDEFEKLI